MFFLSRIASDGSYVSPNICFAKPEEPEVDDHDTPEADADEGAGEGDADTDGAADEDGEGAADDPAADAGDEGDEDAVGAEPAAALPKRNASDVIRENKRARKEAAARADEAQRKADEALRRAEAAERRAEDAERRAQERRQAETEAQEAERLAVMSEAERLDYYRRKDREESDRRFNQLQFQQWDSADRMEFRQLVKEDPLVAKVKDQVESEFSRLQKEGRPVGREILANQFIAKLIREERGRAGTKQRQTAAARVKRETVRAPQTRSGAPAQRTRRGEGDSKAAR